MKKVFLVALFCLFQAFTLFAAEGFVFRKAHWGMSKDEVKVTEMADLFDENENTITYEAIILEASAKLTYIFEAGRLFLIAVSWGESAIYKTAYEALVLKYGDPSEVIIGLYTWTTKLSTIYLNTDYLSTTTLAYADLSVVERKAREKRERNTAEL